MKSISVFYTARARKDLKKLDGCVASRIVKAVKRNCESDPLSRAKALSGVFDGLFRYRVGDYRVLFEYDDNGRVVIITIIHIAHRKDAYE